MPLFRDIFERYSWDQVKESIYRKTATDVEKALGRVNRDLEDFKALISPAAEPYLEEMARTSRDITQKRFGRIMQMFAPMYLSNECHNICTYCGFRMDNKLPRVTLTKEQILKEVEVLKQHGFDHILLVTGEANKTVETEYFKKALETIRPYFSNIGMEVQPLDQEEYEELIPYGLHNVLVYQETYNKANYRKHHPKGKKANFQYRVDTPDRLGKAKIHKTGLGVLLGLEDWRTDSFFTALHLKYLEKTYWQTKYSISFPRLRPAEGHPDLKSEMYDKQLLQLICAYRLIDEDVELSLSTREDPKFRDNVIPLGVTSMSAGSKTDPGGYSNPKENLEQFEISDERTPEEMARVIQSKGYEPVWKDWEKVFV